MLVFLILVFLLTSIIIVVTGSTSLITVPALLSAGMDARVAVATNMFALIFLSAGATYPFLRSNHIHRPRLPLLIVFTLVGSVIGAGLLVAVPTDIMPLLIAFFMLAMVVFSVLNPKAGLVATEAPSRNAVLGGYVVTFLLGIYGGFFSGGYVTLLTAAYVALFGMAYIEAVATTKVINIFSSLVATAVFIQQGLVDFEWGLALGAAALVGGMVGARVALRVSNVWLRRIFLASVVILALRLLVVDVLWPLVAPA